MVANVALPRRGGAVGFLCIVGFATMHGLVTALQYLPNFFCAALRGVFLECGGPLGCRVAFRSMLRFSRATINVPVTL